MKESDKIILSAVVYVIISVTIFLCGFGLGIYQGREEYKNELHKQVKEHNKLLKEYVALLDKIKKQSK